MLDVKKMLAKLLNCDYVIEEGSSGIWTYRKWASGISECWGIHNQSITSWTQWGGTYYSAPYNVQVSYPPDLFIAEPVLTATPRGTALDAWLISNAAGDSTKTGAYYFGRGLIGPTNQSKGIFFHAKGFWKTYSPVHVGGGST